MVTGAGLPLAVTSVVDTDALLLIMLAGFFILILPIAPAEEAAGELSSNVKRG